MAQHMLLMLRFNKTSYLYLYKKKQHSKYSTYYKKTEDNPGQWLHRLPVNWLKISETTLPPSEMNVTSIY